MKDRVYIVKTKKWANRFTCLVPDCRKEFKKVANMRDHIRVHTDEKPFGCEVCGAHFSQRSNLNKHLLRVHEH